MTIEDLGRRAIACEGWDWFSMYGAECLPVDRGHWKFAGGRFAGYDNGEYTISRGGEDTPNESIGKRAGRRPEDGGWLLPDLTDPATLGGLIELVREAWSEGDKMPDIFGVTYHCDGGWCVEVYDRHFYGESMAEALVAALEAAP